MSDDILRDSIRGDIRELNKRLKTIEEKREAAEKDGCGPMPKPVWSPSEQRFHVKDEQGVTSKEGAGLDPDPDVITFDIPECYIFWGVG